MPAGQGSLEKAAGVLQIPPGPPDFPGWLDWFIRHLEELPERVVREGARRIAQWLFDNLHRVAEALARRILALIISVNRLYSLVLNFLVDLISVYLTKGFPGSYEITGEIDPCLIQAVEKHYAASFKGVRFVQLGGLPLWMVKHICGTNLAVTWVDTVYVYPNGLKWTDYNETCNRNDADTVAHELWHIHQFRSLGGGPGWMGRWLGEYVRYGLGNMPIEVEARSRAASFLGSREYKDVRALRKCGK